MLTDYFETYASNHRAYKGGPWCYEDGLIYRGLWMLHQSSKEDHWLDHVQRMVDIQIGNGTELLGYDLSAYNIDNIQPGRSLLSLHAVTGEPRYMTAAGILISQLSSHPRTKSGVYWHKLRYPWQVWLDGLYMGAPFQIEYGLKTGDDALVDDALTQLDTALKMTFVPETGLYAHAVDEACAQPWAQAGTGHTKAHWARSIGWLAMALVDIAELVGRARFAPFKARTEKLLADIARLQQADGRWLQVIDQPDLTGNYPESSATAMFVYALLKGAQEDLWSRPVDGIFDRLIDNTIRPTQAGGMEMVEICHVAGLGMFEGRFRDGTAAYYVSEAKCSDDPKGVGPLMMAAATEMARSKEHAAALAGE